jgi:predicted nucleic acid-binding protein
MRIYLDMCALKRPWDDQSQPRVASETGVILALLDLMDRGRITAVRSPVHDEENGRNPNPERAAAISRWLERLPFPEDEPAWVAPRARELVRCGLRPFDALHLSWAEALGADVLVTTDDRFASRARATRPRGSTPVRRPSEMVEDLPP